MPGVFISYRRDDTSAEAQQVADDLVRKFGKSQVFFDVDDIDIGVQFEDAIDASLAEIDAFVPIIGPDWVNASDHEGRVRLFNEGDLVRQEIAHALSTGVAVIPVLVDGATMPRKDQLPPDLQPLCGINALKAGSTDLEDATERLARRLKDDLTVRTTIARAGGGLLYSWTAFFGIVTLLLVMLLQSCEISFGEDETPPPDTRPLGLVVVVLVFLLGGALVYFIRRSMRARRGIRRVAVTAILYVIAPALMVAATWLAFLVDPNPD